MYKDLKSLQAGSFAEVEIVTDLEAIKNSIKNVLSTVIGSIPGKPNFGSKLHLIVFEQLDSLTEQMAGRYTREALARHEDRISVMGVTTTKNEAFNRLSIVVQFAYKDNFGRTKVDSTTVPFNL